MLSLAWAPFTMLQGIGKLPEPRPQRLFTATRATETNTLSPPPTSLEACSESAFLRPDEHPRRRAATSGGRRLSGPGTIGTGCMHLIVSAVLPMGDMPSTASDRAYPIDITCYSSSYCAARAPLLFPRPPCGPPLCQDLPALKFLSTPQVRCTLETCGETNLEAYQIQGVAS